MPLSKVQVDEIFKRVKDRTTGLSKEASQQRVQRVSEGPDSSEDEVPVGLHGLLSATEKLLAVNRGLVPTDERDSQQFKRLFTTPMLLRERVRLDADKTRLNVLRRAARFKSLKGMHAFMFDPYTEGHILGNPLSLPLEEINPISLVEQNRRVTQMGPGGLGSDEAITDEARALHPSQFGFLSTIEGPESSRIGIDTRVAWGTKVGDNGKLYQRFYDRKAKKHRWLSPEDLHGLTLGLPE